MDSPARPGEQVAPSTYAELERSLSRLTYAQVAASAPTYTASILNYTEQS